MDTCLCEVKEKAADSFARLLQHYEIFMRQMEACRNIRVGSPAAVSGKDYCFRAWDICKLVISVKGTSMSGQALYDTLRDEFHLQMEMAAASYVLAIMTIADDAEGWQRLADALRQIDDRIEEKKAEEKRKNREEEIEKSVSAPPAKMTIAQALNKVYGSRVSGGVKTVPLAQAAGCISGDFVCLYPPGIPLLVPGEIIEEPVIGQIEESLRLGLRVQGVSVDETVIIC